MTKMSLSCDEAEAANRRPFVWWRGLTAACVGHPGAHLPDTVGELAVLVGLDSRAAGWQGSCWPPTGAGAERRKGVFWAELGCPFIWGLQSTPEMGEEPAQLWPSLLGRRA